MTIMYKMVDEQEPQYLVNTLSFKTSNKTTRHNTTNSKQLIGPFSQKRTQGNKGFAKLKKKKLLKTHF